MDGATERQVNPDYEQFLADTTEPVVTTEPAPAKRARNRAPKAAKPKAETNGGDSSVVYLLVYEGDGTASRVDEEDLASHASEILTNPAMKLYKAVRMEPTVTFNPVA
jgi:hypothetical protein